MAASHAPVKVRDRVGVPEKADIVRYEDLFPEAHDEALHAGGEFVEGLRPAIELVVDILVADDGSRDELGEEGHEGAEFDEVLLHAPVPPVHVDGIAHGLEGVEGNADGERQPKRGDGDAGDAAEGLREEIEILEEEQKQQVDDRVDGQHRPRFAPLVAVSVDQPPAHIVQADGKQHEQDIHRLPPAVEHEIHGKEPRISEPGGDEVIHRQHDGQVDKEKKYAGKDHGNLTRSRPAYRRNRTNTGSRPPRTAC